MKRYAWTYNPGLMDACDPTVIRGTAIASGARVRIAREFTPRLSGWTRTFAMIEDTFGNVQSVFKAALMKGTK